MDDETDTMDSARYLLGNSRPGPKLRVDKESHCVSLASVFLSQIALASLFADVFWPPHGHNEIRSWMYTGVASLFLQPPIFYPNEQRNTEVHLLASLSLHMVNWTSVGPMIGFLSCFTIWMRGTKERQGGHYKGSFNEGHKSGEISMQHCLAKSGEGRHKRTTRFLFLSICGIVGAM